MFETGAQFEYLQDQPAWWGTAGRLGHSSPRKPCSSANRTPARALPCCYRVLTAPKTPVPGK